MSVKVEDLVPEVAAVAQRCLNALVTMGIPHAVTSTLRTLAEQQALFAQGRQSQSDVNILRRIAGMVLISGADNAYTVTNADGVKYKSNHQSGRAIDVVPVNDAGNPEWPYAGDPRWQQIAAVFKSQGFTWGGDWTKAKDGIDPDLPHYEMSV